MIGDATPTAAAAVRRGGTPRVPAEARWTAAIRDGLRSKSTGDTQPGRPPKYGRAVVSAGVDTCTLREGSFVLSCAFGFLLLSKT
jgi:hypothetical protein